MAVVAVWGWGIGSVDGIALGRHVESEGNSQGAS